MSIPGRHRSAALCALGLAAALAACAPSESDLVDEAREHQAAGRFRQSLAPLRILVESGSEDPEVHFLYGVALTGSGRPGDAVWPLRKAMESPDWIVPAGLQLASSSLASGDFDSAVEAASQVLEVEPDAQRARVLRAMARVRSRRDYEGALADADRVLESDPDDVDALLPRAVALLALERVDEAGAVLQRLDARFRDDALGIAGSPLFCTALASFAKEKGDFETATERYERCLEAFPAESLVVQDAVEFFDRTGRRERSDEILRAALEEAPASLGYRNALALRLDAQGRADDAEALLRAGTELEVPRLAAQAWADLAAFHIAHEDYEAGAEAMDRARGIVADPTPEMLFTYADALVLAGRLDDALAVAQEMDLPAHRHLVEGRVHYERGEPAAALESLGEGLRLWPNNAVARYYAALAAEGVGDFDRAIEEYRYALRVDPNATDAHLRLARLYAAEGEVEPALSALAHGAGGRPGEDEATLLSGWLLARQGRIRQALASLRPLLAREERRGAAVAAMAAGLREREGPAAAAALIRSAEGLDLDDPEHAEALAALVDHLGAAGRADEALAAVDEALRAHPEVALFHALRGRALSLTGAPASEVEATYRRALERDPAQPIALAGLARRAAERGDSEEALRLRERAAEAAPDDVSHARAVADLLVALGREADAERRLEALLREHPYEGDAALALARLREARGARDARTLALARRAARFGAGPDAAALVEALGGDGDARAAGS